MHTHVTERQIVFCLYRCTDGETGEDPLDLSSKITAAVRECHACALFVSEVGDRTKKNMYEMPGSVGLDPKSVSAEPLTYKRLTFIQKAANTAFAAIVGMMFLIMLWGLVQKIAS